MFWVLDGILGLFDICDCVVFVWFVFGVVLFLIVLKDLFFFLVWVFLGGEGKGDGEEMGMGWGYGEMENMVG